MKSEKSDIYYHFKDNEEGEKFTSCILLYVIFHLFVITFWYGKVLEWLVIYLYVYVDHNHIPYCRNAFAIEM